ncbi:reverse transcriptase [Cucumis melo var. makuwa]|uniref:Reverse transcriptase n=1 Tax=Cucumis melo var. makuwa TaxID=1194695 RepID=A0A5D3CCZ2_CUCMM|nr:reverse transcriptase [Cucumis melo var. makuwa]
MCASFGSTRLICASFRSTRLICAFYGTTRLLCRVRAQRGADRREAGRTREGHMDASGFLIASAMISSPSVVALVKVDKTKQFWVEEDLLLTKENRLYVLRVEDLRKKLLHECHDPLWYRKMFLICQQDKVEKVKVVELLEFLPIPTRPWESVSMDFITHLSKVGDLEAILVIIDRFSNYVTFIPTTKLCSTELTA